MLGINYQRIESNSVGHKTDFEMRSLDFEGVPVGEGYDDSIVDEMLTHLIEARPFTNVQHKALMDVFLDYCALGGMPDVVRSYIDRNTFEGSLQTQRQLVLDYREDIQKIRRRPG